jgi:two-component system, cell cycle sensor histidine kinase and response regulator CckA
MPNKTILLAEDDDILNRMISQTLESNGFLVLRAGDGRQALALFEAHHAEIDLVISDIEMPGMSGVELRNRLREHNPQLKIVLISAAFPEAQLLELHLGSYDRFIAKPFNISSLLSSVEAFTTS